MHMPETKFPDSSCLHPQDLLFDPSWLQIPVPCSLTPETAGAGLPIATNICQHDWVRLSRKAISYSENHLSWTVCRKQSHCKPFPGRKELTTGTK